MTFPLTAGEILRGDRIVNTPYKVSLILFIELLSWPNNSCSNSKRAAKITIPKNLQQSGLVSVVTND